MTLFIVLFQLKSIEEPIIPIVVIGSGPAGLTAAYHCSRLGYDATVISGPHAGGQLMGAGEVENMPGVDVQPGADIIKMLWDNAYKNGVLFIDDVVVNLHFSQWPFKLTLESGKTIKAYSIIIATGSAPRKLGIPGESEYWGMGVSSCSICDGFLYKDKDVAIIGGGDSAIEQALNIPYAHHITIFVRKSALRAVKRMQDRIKKYRNVTIRYSTEVLKIIGDSEGVTGLEIKDSTTGEVSLFPCTGVFIAIGHNPNTDLFKNEIELSHDGYIKLATRSQQTSVSGVFAAGDVADDKYRQVGIATGTAIQAALEALEFLRDKNILDRAHNKRMF